MHKKFILFLLMLMTWIGTTQAQIVKEKTERAERRAERKVDRKIDQKVDEAVDKAFEKVSSIFKRKKKKKRTRDTDAPPPPPAEDSDDSATAAETETPPAGTVDLSRYFSGEVKLRDSYHFDLAIDYHSTYTRKGRTNETDLTMLFSDEGIYGFMGKEDGKSSYSIFDPANHTMVMLTSDGTGMAMPLSDDSTAPTDEYSDTAADEDVRIYPTGRTKTIVGYHCKEYAIESKHGSGSIWTTKEIKPYKDTSFMGRGKGKINLPQNLGGYGMYLEMTFTENSGEKGHLIATRVDKSGTTLRPADYRIQKLGGQ